jgi:hypothetical protein
MEKAMLTQEDKIRLIHNNRTILLNRIFDGLCRMPGSSSELVAQEIIVLAKQIQYALADSKEIQHPPRGLFVLALQQVVDSWIAGLITNEAFEWLAERQETADQVLLDGIDLGGAH